MSKGAKSLLREIQTSIARRDATFGLVRTEDLVDTSPQLVSTLAPYTLAVGSFHAFTTPTPSPGFIVVQGLTRDQVARLRDTCDELLCHGRSP